MMTGGVVRLIRDLDNDGDRDVVSVATERAAVKWHEMTMKALKTMSSVKRTGVVDVAIADVIDGIQTW